MILPTTIDEVIVQLETIITDEVASQSAMAFFPILYKKVTERIKLGIAQQEFEDNARMERLDVRFANRYIEAYTLFKSGSAPTDSWQRAFEATKDKKLLILQHLLLGINAHINLDLGIAVSETVSTGNLDGIQNDYHKINEILASMVDEVQEKIGQVSPLFYLLEKVAKGKEDAIASFSIEIARDEAWIFANDYHQPIDKQAVIEQRDASIARLAERLYITKSRFLRWMLRFIRWFEYTDVAAVVQVLSEE